MTNEAAYPEPAPSTTSVLVAQPTVEVALIGAASRLFQELCGESSTLEQLSSDGYVRRLRLCLKHHWSKLNATVPLAWDEVLKRLETGSLHYGSVAANILRDVVLAQALEKGRPTAVAVFERDYMPMVRAIARRYYDQRALDRAEGLLAELVLPRNDLAPRIATYQGQTPLVDWVRTVAVRAIVAAVRVRSTATLENAPEAAWSPPAETSECRELVTPLLVEAVTAVDRREIAILQILADGRISQRDLAVKFKLNPGTITRRRQRAMQAIYEQIKLLCERSRKQRRIEECLEAVLAGDDPVLRREFAESLNDAIRRQGDEADGRSHS
jgi:DNA-directed RNA polymerase specialized sigma24 family protein